MSMNWKTKTFRLNNGMELPAVGFGTWRVNDQGEGRRTVREAAECGYRFFDTASFYGTEEILAQGLKDSSLKRDEVILESKLWHDERGYDQTKRALERSLKRLDTDYDSLAKRSGGQGRRVLEGIGQRDLESYGGDGRSGRGQSNRLQQFPGSPPEEYRGGMQYYAGCGPVGVASGAHAGLHPVLAH